jgi:hypothetical protein
VLTEKQRQRDRETESQGQRNRETERQRDGETERQRDKETERQRAREAETERQKDKTERRRDGEAERRRDGETGRQRDRETERQIERQRDGETPNLVFVHSRLAEKNLPGQTSTGQALAGTFLRRWSSTAERRWCTRWPQWFEVSYDHETCCAHAPNTYTLFLRLRTRHGDHRASVQRLAGRALVDPSRNTRTKTVRFTEHQPVHNLVVRLPHA